ncbi:peptide chain release factor H [Sphingobacterium sp. BIGb0165]|uniref:peptide chain release factor H n=1 Tax=Sphingobacterium sp. BIGb0165 TaxID=2940615 RepID=UPI00216A2323|nr:peptide chain release factor H [Sphingobacterium sp. BIGb0165]MCS4224141.1 peptide chain release factor [Sphingobacterium sp. BIGb0165]
MEKYILISSGRGPKECNLAVQLVLERILAEADQYGVKIETVEVEKMDGLPSSIVLKLSSREIAVFRDRWIGTICWISQSPFRPNHRRKNWFVEVKDWYPAKSATQMNLKDVQFKTMRSSGAGGQHVNKVSSAVRATHLPTGLMVQVMDTRSQLQNREIAVLRLEEQLMVLERLQKVAAENQRWKEQIAIERGNSKRIFFGSKFKER